MHILASETYVIRYMHAYTGIRDIHVYIMRVDTCMDMLGDARVCKRELKVLVAAS
jgi:hypothetical protein